MPRHPVADRAGQREAPVATTSGCPRRVECRPTEDRNRPAVWDKAGGRPPEKSSRGGRHVAGANREKVRGVAAVECRTDPNVETAGRGHFPAARCGKKVRRSLAEDSGPPPRRGGT